MSFGATICSAPQNPFGSPMDTGLGGVLGNKLTEGAGLQSQVSDIGDAFIGNAMGLKNVVEIGGGVSTGDTLPSLGAANNMTGFNVGMGGTSHMGR